MSANDVRSSWPLRSVIWAMIAALMTLSVLILNGRPLYYYDTIGYHDQGLVALAQLGLVETPEVADEGAVKAATANGAPTVRTVDGSRSPFYSVLAGLFAQFGVFEGLIGFNALMLGAVLVLAARVIARAYPGRGALVAPAVVVACLGSLPFYVAYLMPDLLAPVMILAMALITGFWRQMTRGEVFMAFALAAVAIVSHLSHFAIGGLLVLGAALVSLVWSRSRWWVAPLIVLAVVAVAWGQQKAFRVIAHKAAHSEVVIKPFLTARLIQDGPGLDWLAEHCPNAEIPTCALWSALQISDDPYRLTASHIVFETSQRLGSFRLMSEPDQKAVADGQMGFFKDVLRDKPVAVTMALLKNSLIQAGMVSIDMTLPNDEVILRNQPISGTMSGVPAHGRLSADTGWVAGYVEAQTALYVASLAAILLLLCVPGVVPAPLKAFAVMILLGILANAFVCGAISQPATRYGARVVWLVPMLAALLVLMTARQNRAQQ